MIKTTEPTTTQREYVKVGYSKYEPSTRTYPDKRKKVSVVFVRYIAENGYEGGKKIIGEPNESAFELYKKAPDTIYLND